MSGVMLSSRLRKHANNNSVKSGKLRHPVVTVPQNSLPGKGSRIERSRRRCLFQPPPNFHLKNVCGGDQVRYVGQKGESGVYASRSTAPEPRSFGRCSCMAAPNAPRLQSTQRRSPFHRVLAAPPPCSSQPATPVLIATPLSAPVQFGSHQCMATPSPPRCHCTPSHSPLLCDLKATRVRIVPARPVPIERRVPLQST